MENHKGFIKDAVEKGAFVRLDTKNPTGYEMYSLPVVLTPSLSDFAKRSDMPNPAAILLGNLKRCLESFKFTGANKPRVLKVYVSAKDNMYFESITIPWDETGKPCLVFAMPGQINDAEGSISELSPDARAAFAEMTPAEHEAVRLEALKRAQDALSDPLASEALKRASKEILAIDAAMRRKEQEGR